MKFSATILVLLVLMWAVWSGHYSLEILIFEFGVLSCLFVTWTAVRMRACVGPVPGEAPSVGVLARLPRYLGFLFLGLAQANLTVARLILDPKMPISPRLLRVRASQRSTWAQVVHANSITLTPGTLTLDLRNGELLVHALSSASASSVESGAIDRAVTRLEGQS